VLNAPIDVSSEKSVYIPTERVGNRPFSSWVVNPFHERLVGLNCRSDRKSDPRGINLRPSPGFRRGESGWVDVGCAFRVAWEWGCRPFSDEPASSDDPWRATFMVAPTDIDELFLG
jgi:hypothetical protein